MKIQSERECTIHGPATGAGDVLPRHIDDPGRERPTSRFQNVALWIIATVVLLSVYLLRLDQVAGQFKDDGWYIILAKSLATGHGYNLLNLPQHSGLSFYPPFFPFLLSLLYRLSPEFPGNVFLLKSLSIFSMLLLPVLVFRLFNERDGTPRVLAYLIGFSASLAPSFVMLATSTVMSEGVFTVLMFATLLVTERLDRLSIHTDSGIGASILAALLASACYLTRTIGIFVIAAVAIHLLARKMYKPFAAFAAVTAICIAPWMVYQHARAADSSPVPRFAAGYSSQFWDRYAAQPGPKVTVRDLPGRIWQVSTVILGDDVGGLIFPSFYRSGSESGEELIDMTTRVPGVSRNFLGQYGSTMGLSVSGQVISLVLSILVFIGFFYSARGLRATELAFTLTLMFLIVWPSSPIRYLVPLVPLFLYYLVLGTRKICGFIARTTERSFDPWSGSRVLIICVLAFFLYDNGGYVAARRASIQSFQHPDWLRQFDGIQQADKWVRDHTSSQEVITSDNMPMTYLYTQHQTEWNEPEYCSRSGIHYYLNTEYIDMPMPSKLVFQTTYWAVQVLDISNHNQSPPQNLAAAKPYRP